MKFETLLDRWERGELSQAEAAEVRDERAIVPALARPLRRGRGGRTARSAGVRKDRNRAVRDRWLALFDESSDRKASGSACSRVNGSSAEGRRCRRHCGDGRSDRANGRLPVPAPPDFCGVTRFQATSGIGRFDRGANEEGEPECKGGGRYRRWHRDRARMRARAGARWFSRCRLGASARSVAAEAGRTVPPLCVRYRR